ncbi:MAG: tetratricopeptide repeat protein [Candidatus Latescibacter sp.]|nr:tetratricopeptide repeat protein [Candidatus Latescibacter sp.]
MKKIIVPCFIIFLALASSLIPPYSHAASFGTESAALYNRAGDLYRQGKFREALDIYEQLLKGGVKDPDLYYNASNAAWRLNLTGKAVLYLERALKLDPSDRDALANLAFINSRKQDKETPPMNAVTAFLENTYERININSAALWSGLAFALMMLSSIGLIFLGGWVRLPLVTALSVCGLLFIVSTAVLVDKVHRDSTETQAVIMAGEVDVYSGPGAENIHIFTIHEGTKVLIERRQNSWDLIRLKSGVGGWMAADSLQVI